MLPSFECVGTIMQKGGPKVEALPKSGKIKWSARVKFENRKKNDDGEWESNGEFWCNVEAFGDLAESLAEERFDHLDKVMAKVWGLNQRTYARKDGSEGMAISAIVDELYRVEWSNDANGYVRVDGSADSDDWG